MLEVFRGLSCSMAETLVKDRISLTDVSNLSLISILILYRAVIVGIKDDLNNF